MNNEIYKVCFILIYIHINVPITIQESVDVKVKGSIFIGKQLFSVFQNKPYSAFWKIPYAKEPLRELRFKPPELNKLRNETFDYSNCRKDTCRCYEEDCLHLSIFMPFLYNQTRSIPVVVWLGGTSKSLRPDFFIEEEVVVVTVSYRKGIFGFLNTGDEFAEGNMGAKDTVVALKWINSYIGSFHGDPNRVTVVGVRKAATIVASLLLTSVADGLFKRVIIMSGSALSPSDYRNYNFEVTNKLYWNLNGTLDKLNRTKLYEMLKNYTTTEIYLASRDIFDSTDVRDNQRLINAFSLSVESSKDAFMKRPPWEVYKSRLTNNNIDVLMGYTSLESLYKLNGFADNKNLLMYLNYNFQYLLPFEGIKDEYGSKRYRKIRKKIMDFYFINGTIGVRSLRRYAKYVSDQVIYPLVRQARLHAEVSCRNVYLYRFSFKGLFNMGWDSSVPYLNWSGATAGDEICYLFKCKSVYVDYNNADASIEGQFIKKFLRLLTNFAKSGDPTPTTMDNILGDLKWEPLRSDKSLRAMNLSRKLKMVDVPEGKRVKFWDELKSEFFAEQVYKEEF
ncbi:unnamed protein product [Diatraea saccharalis]|uniref:Carboxylesterase type B domain-containing protein n=1 Tax=Diatraea saccharalis TaxID=40085 RepID=A0A9N9WKU4_9NEOP|nr:unnamed protein product [Diatraea saccharalis]